ncbi:HEAT repeat-containing protein 5B, partial [Coemansia sp. RSA 2611]
MPLSVRRQGEGTGEPVADDGGARPFSSAAKQLAVAAIVAILECIERVRPLDAKSAWRSHPLTPMLADFVSVGYMAASAPAAQSPTLCCLGQHLLQRLIAQFRDVEDPALRGEGKSVLGIYQAQLSSAFMPVLSEAADLVVPQITQAAIATATAFVVSGLVSGDRSSLLRILRLLAPQAAFADGGLAPQMQVVTRLTILSSWATIFGYARKRQGVLRDALELHLPLLGGLWMDAIRDTAVIGMRQRDVYEELAFLGGAEHDIGMGLKLGLESTYVGLV